MTTSNAASSGICHSEKRQTPRSCPAREVYICVVQLYIGFYRFYIGFYRFYIGFYKFYIGFHRFYIGFYRIYIRCYRCFTQDFIGFIQDCIGVVYKMLQVFYIGFYRCWILQLVYKYIKLSVRMCKRLYRFCVGVCTRSIGIYMRLKVVSRCSYDFPKC